MSAQADVKSPGRKSVLGAASAFLTRQTSGRKLIPEIDGLRSVAILSVVAFHASGNFRHYTSEAHSGPVDEFIDRLLRTGEYGVPLFFVISGFILALPFASHHLLGEPRPTLGRYFLRRLTRLEPPYLLALTAAFAIALVRNEAGLPEALGWYAASAIYQFNTIFGEAPRLMVVAWSLEVEVQFYLLAPFITTIFMIKNIYLRRAIIAAAIIGLSLWFGVTKPIAGRTVLHQGSYFLAGLLLADFYLFGLRDSRPGRWWGDALSIFGIAGTFLALMYELLPPVTTPWLILLGYASVFRALWVRRFFRWSPVVILGGMCYTIYLWHFPLIALSRHALFRVFPFEGQLLHRLLYIAISGSLAIGVTAVLFALIERPTMDPRWPQKLMRRIGLVRTESQAGPAVK